MRYLPRIRNILAVLVILFPLSFFAGGLPLLALAERQNNLGNLGREELERQAQERAKELEKINQQITATQESIRTTAGERQSIQQELKRINTNIKQLQLSVRGDELSLEKLGFEIQTVTFDIDDIETSITEKKDAVRAIIKELQKRSAESSLLLVFLKNAKLADSVLAAQALFDLNAQLTIDIKGLDELGARLESKRGVLGKKKNETELHHTNLVNRKLIVQDQEKEKQVILVQTKNRESLYQQQLTELEKQQEAIAEEINRIEDELRARFDVSILPTKRHGLLAWPVQRVEDGGKGRITQHFGERSALYRGKPHNGLDIGAPLGTPVFAADDGEVVAVDNNDQNRWRRYQYGKYVVVRHPNNLATLYAHLSQQTTGKGAMVRRGDLIGYVGKTGYATGPHLHFGLYWAPSIIMKSIPPAAGVVPIGVVIAPEEYL